MYFSFLSFIFFSLFWFTLFLCSLDHERDKLFLRSCFEIIFAVLAWQGAKASSCSLWFFFLTWAGTNWGGHKLRHLGLSCRLKAAFGGGWKCTVCSTGNVKLFSSNILFCWFWVFSFGDICLGFFTGFLLWCFCVVLFSFWGFFK